MKLIHRMPSCTPSLNERIERLLEPETCGGYLCKNTHVAMRRRIVGGNETLHLQCTECGRSLGGSLPKRECFGFADLEPWDTEIGKAFNAVVDAKLEQQREELFAGFRAAEQQREERRRRYDEWLLTSPEWKRIRHKVMKRAGFVCEQCLEAEARDVHHDTYELGVLPPTWLLHAVCRSCHLHLHNFKPVFV